MREMPCESCGWATCDGACEGPTIEQVVCSACDGHGVVIAPGSWDDEDCCAKCDGEARA